MAEQATAHKPTPWWMGSQPDLLEAAENALACLRHTHDRLVEYPEFETLRITINAECRSLRSAIAKTESGHG